MAKPVGFLTDTTLCIGCKACEVACKEWNGLPNNPLDFRGGYDNTGQLDHENWRHVRFLENASSNPDKPVAWSMMSDVCKHCANASCLHAMFILTDKPEAYGLPSTESAVLPSRNNVPSYLTAALTAILAGVAGLIAFRRRGEQP